MCLNPEKYLVTLIGPQSRLYHHSHLVSGGGGGLEMEFTELQCFDSGHRDSNGQGGHLNPGSPTLMSPGQPGWKTGF